MTSTVKKAMVLAAGKGERMRPLTDACPKPLLKIKNKTLIEYSIEKLKQAGISDCVINISYFGHLIENFLGDGTRYGMHITYSREDQPLETGGGIARALPLLCKTNTAAFLLVNSDVWSDIDLSALRSSLQPGKLVHLVLVKNPAHNLKGDFALKGNSVTLLADGEQGFTYSGISVINPELFKRYSPNQEKFPLRDLLVQAIKNDEVSGEVHRGVWVDVGTPERLKELDQSSS